MGIWIIDNDDRAVLYDSTTERPFGPGFHSRDEAENFIRYAVAIGCGKALHACAPAAEVDDIHNRWCRLTKCSQCFESIDYTEANELIEEDDATFMERMEVHIPKDEQGVGAVIDWKCDKCMAKPGTVKP